MNSLPNFTVFFFPVSSKSFVFAKAKFSQSKNDERRNVSGFVKVAFLFFAVILGLKIVLTLPISEFNHCLKFATERSALKRCFQRLPAWVPVGSVPFFFIILLGERDGILRNRLGFFNSDRLYGDCLSSSSAY